MQYTKYTITTPHHQLETLYGQLLMAGIEEMQIEDPLDVDDVLAHTSSFDYDIADQSLLNLDKTALPQIVFYVKEEEIGQVEALLATLPEGSWTKENMDDQDWVQVYRSQFHTIALTPEVVIVPTWEQEGFDTTQYQGKKPVFMDPGTAFGTGEHPTTYMCGQLLHQEGCQGKRILDIGTGSGILALAAAKEGASQVDAVDIDPESVLRATENVALNGETAVIRVFEGDVTKGLQVQPYDVLVANLFAEILAFIAPNLPTYMKEEGVFIASGILEEKKTLVVEALEKAGLVVEHIRQTGEWIALVARKQHA